MPTYLHPGVYVEEIPSGVKPIEGVPTSVAAFVGRARKGPVGAAVPVNSFDEYRAVFGDIASEADAMGLALRAFYLNGGKTAFVARLVNGSPPTAAASATVAGQDSGGNAVLRVQATSVGQWGNAVYFRIVKPDPDAPAFDLEVGHLEKDKFRKDETFAGLTMNAGEAAYALTQVNGSSAWVELALEPAGDPDDAAELYQDATLTGGVLGTAADAFAAGMSGIMSLTLNINGLGAKKIDIDPDALGLAGTDNQADGDLVAGAIVAAVRALGPDIAYQSFVCGYGSNRFTLTSPKPAQERTCASLMVYDGTGDAGDLAAFLRLGSKAAATFVGAGLDTTNATLFSDGITGTMDLTLDMDGLGSRTISIQAAELGLAGNHDADSRAVALAIRDAVQAIPLPVDAYRRFDCVYAGGRFVLTSGSVRPRTSSLTVADGPLADLLGLAPGDNPTLTAGREIHHGTARVIPLENLGPAPFHNGVQLTGGGEAPPTGADYGTFFNQVLRKIRDVSILVLPGQHWAKDGSGNAAIGQALAHAEATRSRVVIVDPPPGEELEQAAQVDQMALPTSTYSVLYYPWVKVANPFYNADTNPTAQKTLKIAPSAFAAGMWAKIDGKRGVWKAPAGVESQLLGMAGLEFDVEDAEQDQLNPLGVNCLRKLPSFGAVIWGSRTLSTKADPEWRYVPVRRTAIMIEQSIYGGIQWAVFEPNDHRLWASLRTNIGAFMDGLFRAGAFQGEKASDAYFVRCSLGDTMTQDDIDRGQVIVIVGFAPLKPAEFVIVRIQQKVARQ
ncbi:MAG: phage tail sheath family protein [Desulfobacterales bacterium]